MEQVESGRGVPLESGVERAKPLAVLLVAGLCLGAVALFGHRWLALAWNAWGFAEAGPSARTEVVVASGRAYLAAGVDGIEIVDLDDLDGRQRPNVVPPSAPSDRIDDLAIADGWLFALDATPPGYLTTYRLTEAGLAAPVAVAAVPVGPFSGVSAAGGVVAVSGGTSQLTVREFDGEGRLSAEVVSADFGRGQPDIALRADGGLAAISTHLYGPKFALTFVEIGRRPLRLTPLGRLELDDAGFTSGGFKPSHFPLVAAWRGDRVILADGGGMAVVDLSDAAHPRILLRDRLAAPASDLAVAGDELDVARAGRHPAVLRYRLDRSGLPTAVGIWHPPAGSGVAAIARDDTELVVTRHQAGWQVVPRAGFWALP